MRRPRLDDHPRHEQCDSGETEQQWRARPVRRRPFDQGVDDAGEPERQHRATGNVDLADRVGIASFRYVLQRDRHRRGDERQVDEEHEPPRHGVDQVATEKWTDRGRDATEPRPRPDRAPAVLLSERRGDDREAARYERRGGDALQTPRADEQWRCRRDAAQERRAAEADEPDEKHLATPEEVAERSADDEQRSEREQVAGQHPLQVGEVGVQVLGDRRQRRVDDRAVEEGDTRPEHCRGDDPAAFGRAGAKTGALNGRRCRHRHGWDCRNRSSSMTRWSVTSGSAPGPNPETSVPPVAQPGHRSA